MVYGLHHLRGIDGHWKMMLGSSFGGKEYAGQTTHSFFDHFVFIIGLGQGKCLM